MVLQSRIVLIYYPKSGLQMGSPVDYRLMSEATFGGFLSCISSKKHIAKFVCFCQINPKTKNICSY